ncbi:hypothetical protein OEM_p101260 (plasmid) [Mycobacterium intracellulare subsp. yongonense 05-1390]|nr:MULTISPECIES: hypothetical protein [Mycobacterium]AFV14906.1 hypothetical protein OEM_p101260 [Mycobacterium intracellulare subsp. yongonense 05-1390]MBG0730334.1 hypothetical protein [Mycobacterium avium]BDE17057.1 hypothetical protein MKCMC460_59170 [Mycobacterium sp. 20KCMC460]GLC22611.1 hypothetical protein SRL2020472_51820 [Mycobacterium kiyosense]GLD03667.1 hypothetical protein Mkiyose1088_55330 [Mycobacterium kiyosense]
MTSIAVPDPWAITDPDEAQALSAPGPAAHDAHSHARHREDGNLPDVDELAVLQVANDGLRLPLRGDDRDEAVRRMHGRIDPELIAWRLYTTSRTRRASHHDSG